MNMQDLNKLYDDLCHKIVEIKFIQQEIYNMATLIYEELYIIKHNTEEEMEKMAEYYGEIKIL